MKCFEHTLYHGTKRKHLKRILSEGLKPTYLGNSIICMSPSIEEARHWGQAVLGVDVQGYEISCFDDCAEWERFVWTKEPISPDRLRRVV